MRIFRRFKNKEIEDLQNDLYKLNTVVKSLCEELGYAVDFNLEWDEVSGVIKKDKKVLK
jgi:hypothetical protein